MIRRHAEKSARIEPLSIIKLNNNFNRYHHLKPLFKTFAWKLKSKARKASFGDAKVEIKFLANRTCSISSV